MERCGPYSPGRAKDSDAFLRYSNTAGAFSARLGGLLPGGTARVERFGYYTSCFAIASNNHYASRFVRLIKC